MFALVRNISFMVLVVILTSCSSSSSSPAQTPSSIAFSIPETTLIAEPEGVELSDADANLVNFQAKWVCEFQRRTFADQTSGAEALTEALAEAEIAESSYSAFLERLNDNQDLRDLVLFSYQETCRG